MRRNGTLTVYGSMLECPSQKWHDGIQLPHRAHAQPRPRTDSNRGAVLGSAKGDNQILKVAHTCLDPTSFVPVAISSRKQSPFMSVRRGASWERSRRAGQPLRP
jgi:hypothetical protein